MFATQEKLLWTAGKRELITKVIKDVRSFRFCSPEDDPIEQTAVTLGYRYLVIQFERLASPILSEAVASQLNAIDVEVNSLYSVFEASAELDALLPDIESALPEIIAEAENKIQGVYEPGQEYTFYRDLSSLLLAASRGHPHCRCLHR